MWMAYFIVCLGAVFSGVDEGEAAMLSGTEPVLDLKVDPLEKINDYVLSRESGCYK